MNQNTRDRENARKAVSRNRDGTMERMKVWEQERKENALNAIKFIIMIALILLGCRI